MLKKNSWNRNQAHCDEHSLMCSASPFVSPCMVNALIVHVHKTITTLISPRMNETSTRERCAFNDDHWSYASERRLVQTTSFAIMTPMSNRRKKEKSFLLAASLNDDGIRCPLVHIHSRAENTARHRHSAPVWFVIRSYFSLSLVLRALSVPPTAARRNRSALSNSASSTIYSSGWRRLIAGSTELLHATDVDADSRLLSEAIRPPKKKTTTTKSNSRSWPLSFASRSSSSSSSSLSTLMGNTTQCSSKSSPTKRNPTVYKLKASTLDHPLSAHTHRYKEQSAYPPTFSQHKHRGKPSVHCFPCVDRWPLATVLSVRVRLNWTWHWSTSQRKRETSSN